MSYSVLHCHSDRSLLDGLSKPHQIAARVRHAGLKACALTDHGLLAGIPAFIQAMGDVCRCGYQPNQHANGGKGACTVKGSVCTQYEKDSIKAILGLEAYLCAQDPTVKDKTNRSLSHLVVLAKNREGWRNLVQASTHSNRPEHVYYGKPRLTLEQLAGFAKGQWITFSGHPGSDLANICFADPKAAYGARTYEDARSFAKDWNLLRKDVLELTGKYQDLFGKGNFFLEKQLIDHKNCPAALIIAKVLDWVSKQTGIPCVATPDAHYPTMDDAGDQRVLLCTTLDTTLGEASRKLAAGEDIGLGGFFRSQRYHIPTAAELLEAGNTQEELENTIRVSEACEAYDIRHEPRMPVFTCPDGQDSVQYIRALCADGWNRKVAPKVPAAKHQEYRDRLEHELNILLPVGLAPYFLIVHDFNTYAQQKLNCPVDPGRGSASGCLLSYLLNITDTDPIKYDLSFDRFYNSSRNNPKTGEYTMPDIDLDYPSDTRDKILEYIQNKYGVAHVAQMSTFSELQGREAITTVLRAHSWGTHEERKRVTKSIPDKAAITDDLQEMMEESGESSILMWALENNAKDLKEWAELQEDGSISGPLGRMFEQAIRLEGTKKSQGRHPSGVIISPTPLADDCPLIYDKGTKGLVTGFDMHGTDALGFLKMDVLATRVNDKLRDACIIARTGTID